MSYLKKICIYIYILYYFLQIYFFKNFSHIKDTKEIRDQIRLYKLKY